MELTEGRRALLLEPDFYGEDSLSRLRRSGVEPRALACPGRSDLIRELEEARAADRPYSALFVRLGLAVDARVFDAAGPGLAHVITPTTGLAHIDVEEAARRGIRLLSLKGELGFLRTITSTAELAWGLLLALVRRIPSAHADILAGRWRRDPFRGRELRGMTLGIVGLGRLGSMVAGYAKAFGMRVLACDVRREAFADPALSHVEPRDLDALLGEADVVSLHLPLEASTRGIIDAGRIARLKMGAWLVNTARGEVLDETALLPALREGRLAGCALDVLHDDGRWDAGVPEDHPLIAYARKHDNLILTPHIGGYSLDAITRTRSFMVERYCENPDRMGRPE